MIADWFFFIIVLKSIFIYSIELLKVLRCHKDINKTNTLCMPLYFFVIYHQCHITHKQFIFLIYRESRVRIKRLNKNNKSKKKTFQFKSRRMYINLHFNRISSTMYLRYNETRKINQMLHHWQQTKKSLTGKYVQKSITTFLCILFCYSFLCVVI